MQAAIALTAGGPTPGRRRDSTAPRWILAVSLAAHALILAALVRGVPVMGPLVEPPAVDIELLTPERPLPQIPAPARPAEPPASTAPIRPATPPSPTAVAPSLPAKPGPPTQAIAPPGFKARALTEGGDPLREAARDGIGCRNADLLALTKAQRAVCDEALGEKHKNGPALYAVIDPDKKAAFDGACKKDDDWCLYRTGKGPYPGLFAIGRKKKIKGWD